MCPCHGSLEDLLHFGITAVRVLVSAAAAASHLQVSRSLIHYSQWQSVEISNQDMSYLKLRHLLLVSLQRPISFI